MISVKKIFHKNAYRIGLFFNPDNQLNAKAKAIGAVWSQTHKCWHVPYSSAYYRQVQQTFPEIEIISDKNNINKASQQEPDLKQNHDNAPIVTFTKGDAIQPKNGSEHNPPIGDEKKDVAIVLEKDVGKYWVLKIPYSEKLSKALLKIKGVYWNKQYKAYMVFRHAMVKTKVEALLGAENVLPSNFYQSTEADGFSTGEIVVERCETEKKHMKVKLQLLAELIQQVKRFQGARYSKETGAYILPATPVFRQTDVVCNFLNEPYIRK